MHDISSLVIRRHQRYVRERKTPCRAKKRNWHRSLLRTKELHENSRSARIGGPEARVARLDRLPLRGMASVRLNLCRADSVGRLIRGVLLALDDTLGTRTPGPAATANLAV